MCGSCSNALLSRCVISPSHGIEETYSHRAGRWGACFGRTGNSTRCLAHTEVAGSVSGPRQPTDVFSRRAGRLSHHVRRRLASCWQILYSERCVMITQGDGTRHFPCAGGNGKRYCGTAANGVVPVAQDREEPLPVSLDVQRCHFPS